MWELIAAAAAGLNAGSGLYIVAAEHPAGLEAGVATYWSFFPKVSTKAVTLSTTLSILTAAGAAAAYFTGDPDKDPAWLTCAAGALSVPVFDFLFVAPTKAVIDSRVMVDQPLAERESWLRSWGRKQIVDVALKVATFGALLLVLGAKGEDGALARLTRPR